VFWFSFDLICFVLLLVLVWFGFAFLVDCDFGDFDLISSFVFVLAMTLITIFVISS